MIKITLYLSDKLRTAAQNGRQFIKYCLVGATGTGLDFLLLYLFVEYGRINYLLAAIISTIVAMVINFTLNKFWTFRKKDGNYFSQLLKYAAAHSIGALINLVVLTLLVEVFGVWYLMARVVGTVFAVSWNFLATKKWVFK